MVKYKLLSLISTVLLLISCAPSKKVLTDLNFETALGKINFRDRYVKLITAKGNITIDSPEFSNSASLRVNLKRPDTLILKFETIFGINLGEVKVYGDSFELVDRFNDRTLSGRVSEYLRRYFEFNLNFDEIIDILIASPRVGNAKVYNFEDYGFSIYDRRGDEEIALNFNSDLELESCVLSKAGAKFFEVRYSRYVKVGETTLPKFIRIYDKHGRGIYLNFSEIKVN
ncbi:MAG: DUF4292 domain-containing protein [Candidatus Kryptonium sp.]